MLRRRLREQLRRYRAAYVALLISALMTAAAVLVLDRSAQAQEQLWMSALAQEMTDRARARIDQYVGFLRGVRGLFLGSRTVESDEFHDYVSALQIQELPALRAAIFAASTDGTVTVVYVDPPALRTELLGIDLMADPRTRSALQQAERSGGPIASTGTVFWMFVHIPPAVRPPPRPNPGADLPGFAGVQVRGDVLWRDLIYGPKRALVGYELRGRAASGADVAFYAEGPLERPGRTIERTIRLEIAGGGWTVRVVADRRAIDAMWWLPLLIATIGGIATVMLFALMCVQIRAVRSAEHLKQLRDEFISAAAHELRTPVTAIKGYSQLLRKWDLEHVRQRGGVALKSIERQADRINRLVQDMLEASRLQRQPLTLAREPFDLVALLREVAEDMRVSFPNHRLVVTDEGPCPVLADRRRIEQVLTNLVSNAARYSAIGSEIRVHVRQVGDEHVTSVQDFGIGIPADRQRYIFQRYYQAHRGTPYEDSGGLGLGLYVSKEIVDAHGGRIWFDNTGGVGTTFRFSLPLRKEADGAAGPDRR